MNILNDFVAGLKFGDTQQYGRLTIRPVIAESDVNLPFLTLEEALDQNVLEITEVDEAGSVPELLVKNIGDIDVILIEGETLEGAKQNRMVNTTTIVPAKGEIVLPVTCVERGRWSYRSRYFSSGGQVAYPSMRRSSHRAVSDNLIRFDRADSDQSGVWSELSAKMSRFSIESETEAAADLEPETLKQALIYDQRPLEEGITHQPGQIGFLAFIDGGFAGGDLFGSPEICRKQLMKLAKGYLIDMVDEGIEFPEIGELEVMKEVVRSEFREHESVGKGREMRFESGRVQGACKVVDDKVSHVTVFPK